MIDISSYLSVQRVAALEQAIVDVCYEAASALL